MSARTADLFEPRVAEWLEDDPDRAPEDVLRTVLAALPSVPQRHGFRRWGDWPLGVTPRLAYLAAVALVVLALVGLSVAGGSRLGPFDSRTPIAPSPSPTPTRPSPSAVTSSPRPEIPLDAFTSPFYRYSIDYPSGWSVSIATEALSPLGPPFADGATVDTFTSPVTGPIPNGKLIGASAELPEESSLREWTTAVVEGWCGEPTTQEPTTISGESALLTTYMTCSGYFHIWATVVRDGVGFHVVWLNFSGAEQEDRRLFEQILASFTFPPPRSPS